MTLDDGESTFSQRREMNWQDRQLLKFVYQYGC